MVLKNLTENVKLIFYLNSTAYIIKLKFLDQISVKINVYKNVLEAKLSVRGQVS